MSRRRATAAPGLDVVIQASAFVRKELVEILRRPRLLVTLVLGPFLLLVVFGNSYRTETVRLRTIFVGPAGGAYEEALAQYKGSLEDYVRIVRYTTDRPGAEKDLARGRADLVVVFPEDPMGTIAAGSQAEVVILNDKLDPVQSTAVQIAARLAVQEVNASILSTAVGKAQSSMRPVSAMMQAALDASAALDRAAAQGDVPGAAKAARELGAQVVLLQQGADLALDASEAVGDRGAADRRARLDSVRDDLARVQTITGDAGSWTDAAVARTRAAEVDRALTEVRPVVEQLGDLDPALLVRPFAAVTRSTLAHPVGVTAFFAPSSIALLLQHLALSFAALAIVRDTSLGLLEVYRVGPTSVVAVMAGRFVAFAVAGAAVGGALLAAVARFLDVPILGSLLWVWTAIVMLLLASVAVGIVIALVSGNDSEVVQYAMLVLLASLFFGGFVLDLELFTYPGKAVSWLLPVTRAIAMLQDAMLRGTTPGREDVAVLGAQIAGYGALATLLFRRRLRVS